MARFRKRKITSFTSLTAPIRCDASASRSAAASATRSSATFSSLNSDSGTKSLPSCTYSLPHVVGGGRNVYSLSTVRSFTVAVSSQAKGSIMTVATMTSSVTRP